MKRLNPNTIVADFRLAATLMAYKKRGGDEGGGELEVVLGRAGMPNG